MTSPCTKNLPKNEHSYVDEMMIRFHVLIFVFRAFEELRVWGRALPPDALVRPANRVSMRHRAIKSTPTAGTDDMAGIIRTNTSGDCFIYVKYPNFY